MKRLSLTFILMCLCHALFASTTVEHAVWDKSPITVKLPVEQERMIAFPGPVKLLHNELEGFAIIQKTKDTFYIKALSDFAPKSVVVRLMKDGGVIKLNVSADASYQNLKPIQIVSSNSGSDAIVSETENNATPINLVTLTRFAIQSLYVPERVLEMPQGVNRAPMQTAKTVSFVSGGGTLAHPLLSFGGDGLMVTAVRINNLLSKKQTIEPAMLFGKWESIAFYPTNTLSPKGQEGDETVIFVTSRKPFGEALKDLQGYIR